MISVILTRVNIIIIRVIGSNIIKLFKSANFILNFIMMNRVIKVKIII